MPANTLREGRIRKISKHFHYVIFPFLRIIKQDILPWFKCSASEKNT